MLVEDGPPSEWLYVVHSGAMDLLHGDQEVDVLEPGEAFGHPSLLTGMAPAFTVRAREPSRCVLIPRDAALQALGHPEGASFVALSLRERLVRAGHTVHALPPLNAAHVGSLVRRPALFLEPGTTVGQAAEAMTRERTVAALVEDRDGLGIITDGDLRERILAVGLGPDVPVRAAMRRPVPSVAASDVLGEALVTMLDAGTREVCVLDDDGRAIGILTGADLARSQHDPFVLRHVLSSAPDAAALAETARAGLPRMLLALTEAGLSAGDVSRVLTVQSDTATSRLIDFAVARLGPAPHEWAWLALGSVARRELTLASDQDNALAYDGGAEHDAYFAAFADDVTAGLDACGFGRDRGDVLASSPNWRMPAADWAATLRHSLAHPDRSGLVRAAVSFDFRHVAGGLAIVPPLVAIIREAPAHPDFLRRLARTVTDVHIPVPRRGPFRRDTGPLDLKKGAVLPIANLARLHALSCGVTISATPDRLRAAEELGALDEETAAGLREAFAIVSHARLEHHVACVRDERPLDDVIEPATLPPLARAELFSALRAVADAQRRIPAYAPPAR